MARPIANARHDPPRRRRSSGPSALLRAVLVMALVVTGVVAVPYIVALAHSIAPQNGIARSSMSPQQLSVPGLDAGACMRYPSAADAQARTVFVDAGHGGLDPGVVGSRVAEKDAALAVATDLESILHSDGYVVVMSRTRDSSVIKLSASDSITGSLTDSAERRDLLARAACANLAGAAALVSIHFDGFSDPSVGGTETFYDAARSFAADNKRLAVDLQSALVQSLGTADRGVWTDDQLAAPALTASGSAYGHLIELGPLAKGWVDSPSQMPGALVEPLFITDPAQAQIAADPSGQRRIAQALASGIQKYLAGS